ncbi:MAG: extracellular solute-binding protein, partial [Clostridia bacterium]|nr:extracellular solute-binding protein [Clostridia bacterium]
VSEVEQDTETAAQAETEAAETQPDYDPKLEAIDGGGADFSFLTRQTDANIRLLDDISAEEVTGEVLNDAIYERNNVIMEKYNVKFATKITGDSSGEIKKTVQAGDSVYSVTFNGLADAVSLSSQGVYMDLSEMPFVDITKPYWSGRIMEDASIYGKYYAGISDLTIQGYFSSGVVYYNKELASLYDLENPYDLVREGKWTLDKLKQLCQNVSSDLNGNGEWDENDQYGITFNNFAWQILFYGSGYTFVEKDAEGSLFFTTAKENLIDCLQQLMPISQDPTVTLYSEGYGRLGGNYRITVCRNAFNEARALFWLEAMYGVPALREMEQDFGLLPVPKHLESQENYSSFVHNTHASSVGIPVTAGDMALTGSILEDMTWESSKTVREAFIETTLKGKYARDNESADMIDVIINSIRVDYGLLLSSYGLTIDSSMRKLMDQGSTDIASFFAANKDKYTETINKFCDNFKD